MKVHTKDDQEIEIAREKREAKEKSRLGVKAARKKAIIEHAAEVYKDGYNNEDEKK